MSEHPSPEDVMAWVDGQAGEAGPAMERHLQTCAHCRALSDDIRGVSGQLAQWTLEPKTFDMPAPRSGRIVQWRWMAMAALLIAGLFAWSWFGTSAPTQNVAPVVVQVFLDWQCPTCTHLEYAPVLDAYAASNPGAVKYVVKDFPLNRNCNSRVNTDVHKAACEAAAAVRMARDRGKEQAFVDWIYINQSSLTPATVKAKAASLLGVTDFDAEYAKKLPEITRDVSEAVVLNVRFTPSVFINGVAVNSDSGAPPSPAQLDRLIQDAMTRLGWKGRDEPGRMRGRVLR